MPDDTQTLHRQLAAVQQTSNVQKGLFGKWHLGGPNSDLEAPNNFGVDYYADHLFNVTDYTDWTLTVNGQQQQSTTYHTTAITDLTIDWIQDQTDPWFAWVAYSAPHTPYHVPPAYLLGDSTAVNEGSPNRDKYFAAIEAMDTGIGRLWRSIPAAERDNTDRGNDAGSGWAVRSAQYKFIQYDDGVEEFYDISSDIQRIGQFD